jgi:hypothetical protein
MSVADAKTALLEELAKESPLDFAEVEERLVPRFSVEKINAAAASLKSEGRVILGYETDGRINGIDFSFITLNSR